MVIDILKNIHSLRTDVDGKIIISPVSQFQFMTYPKTENDCLISVTEDEYVGLLLNLYQFDETLTTVISIQNDENNGQEHFDGSFAANLRSLDEY